MIRTTPSAGNSGKKKSKKKLNRTPFGTFRTATSGAFEPWMIKDAERLTGKLGARMVDLADYFGVHKTTVEYWYKTIPEFRRAIKRARIEKSLKVANGLYKRAVGFKCKDTQMFIHQATGQIKSKEYTKIYPPDVAAGKAFLSIMMRDVWAETTNINMNHSGGIMNYTKFENLPDGILTEEEKEFMFSITKKTIEHAKQSDDSINEDYD